MRKKIIYPVARKASSFKRALLLGTRNGVYTLAALALVLQPYFSIEKALADVITPTEPIYSKYHSTDLATRPFFNLTELGIKYNLAFPLSAESVIHITEYAGTQEIIKLGQTTFRLDIFRADLTYQTNQLDAIAKFTAENPAQNYTWLQNINGQWQKKINLEIPAGAIITLTRAKILEESYLFPENIKDGKIAFTNFDLRVKTAPISPLKITTQWEVDQTLTPDSNTLSDGPAQTSPLAGRYVFYQPFSIALKTVAVKGKLGSATVAEISLALPDIDGFRRPVLYRWDNSMKKFTPQKTAYNFNGKKLISLKAVVSFFDEQTFAVVSDPTQLIGEASWYKVFGCLCAASRDFPRGSRLKVTAVNPIKGKAKSVIVRVNDFGPEAWTERLIDLDSYAYKKLGKTGAGVMPIIVELVDPKTPVSVDGKPEKDKPIKLGATIYIPFQMTPAMLAKE